MSAAVGALALEPVALGFPDVDRRLLMHDRAQLLVVVCRLLEETDASVSVTPVRGLTAIVRCFGFADVVHE